MEGNRDVQEWSLSGYLREARYRASGGMSRCRVDDLDPVCRWRGSRLFDEIADRDPVEERVDGVLSDIRGRAGRCVGTSPQALCVSWLEGRRQIMHDFVPGRARTWIPRLDLEECVLVIGQSSCFTR